MHTGAGWATQTGPKDTPRGPAPSSWVPTRKWLQLPQSWGWVLSHTGWAPTAQLWTPAQPGRLSRHTHHPALALAVPTSWGALPCTVPLPPHLFLLLGVLRTLPSATRGLNPALSISVPQCPLLPHCWTHRLAALWDRHRPGPSRSSPCSLAGRPGPIPPEPSRWLPQTCPRMFSPGPLQGLLTSSSGLLTDSCPGVSSGPCGDVEGGGGGGVASAEGKTLSGLPSHWALSHLPTPPCGWEGH